jgi:putative flavoprotein involved in K+ transport
VLVVGSAQSGIQVTEDLIEAGRRVYLATSAVSRVPRRYRGKDIFEWLVMIGFYDVKTEDVTDPREFEMRPPQISGVGPLGHTQSLQSLARMGAVILGRLAGTRGNTLDIEPSAANNVKFSDEVSRKVKGMIEGYIVKHQLPVPPGEPDPADEPDTDALCASTITSLDLKANDIRSVVWTTGFSSDLNYLKVPVLDGSGRPRHRSGIADIDGLYFIGLPWLRKRKSGLIYGMREDAEFIAGTINRVRST